MFLRYFTLFLLFITNVTYSLKLKNNTVFKSNYNFLESNNCVNTPQVGTHCLFFINNNRFSCNRSYLHQNYKSKLNLKEDEPENENLYIFQPTESLSEKSLQDSTHNIDTNRITHNTIDEYNNLNKLNETNKSEINELVNAALKWETVKIPNPQPEVTYKDIEAIRGKFLRTLDENEQTFGQIVRRSIEEKEAEAAKQKQPKEDWKEVLEEFTIDVEGKKCYGCGANLQCKDDKKRGFVAPEFYEQFNRSNLIKCKRCSSLGSGTYFLSKTANNNIINDPTDTTKISNTSNKSQTSNNSSSTFCSPTTLSSSTTSIISNTDTSVSSGLDSPYEDVLHNISTNHNNSSNLTYFTNLTNEIKHEYIGFSEREEILPDQLIDNMENQSYLGKLQQKEIINKHMSEKTLFRREDEIMKKIKEASTETVNIVRNMLKIKKRKRITILYIVDVIDPHIEVGLLELIKKRQEQYENMQKEEEEDVIDIEILKGKKEKKYKKEKNNKEENRPDGGIKLYLILNKIDLLPKYDKNEIIQYFRKMINSKVDVQLRSKNVFLISSKYNVNINLLLSVILLEAKKLQNQILFIGPTNSGKSTLINAIHHILKINNTKKSTNKKRYTDKKDSNRNSIDSDGDISINNTNNSSNDISIDDINIESQEENRSNSEITIGNKLYSKIGEGVEVTKEKKPKEISLGKRVTSSIVPGTTLGVLGIKLGMGLKIYDTPGIFIPNSLLSYLDHDNLKNVIINSLRPNKAIRLSKGHTLLIDKYVRIDVTKGRDFFVKFYMSDKLDIFVKKSHKLEKFITKRFGNQHLYYPSHYIEQTDDLEDLKYIQELGDDEEREKKEDNESTGNEDETRMYGKDYNDDLEKENKVYENIQKIQNKENYKNIYLNNNTNYLNRKFDILLEGWNSATCDLCIKGLGFMTIGGALKINFNLFTRKDVELYLRKPMFPRNIFPFKPRKN